MYYLEVLYRLFYHFVPRHFDSVHKRERERLGPRTKKKKKKNPMSYYLRALQLLFLGSVFSSSQCFGLSTPTKAAKGIRVDTKTSTWRDEFNRTLLWHGINFVSKEHPFVPTIDDSTIERMNEMGLGVVRLGVMMGGVFPSSEGPDMGYLDTMKTIVDRLYDANILTIIDLHQDVLASNLCGEGVPNWMVNTAELDSMKFPMPLTFSGSAPSQNGSGWIPKPTCSPEGILKFIGWSELYMTDACGKAFQMVYDDVGQLSQYFKKYWNATSSYFSGHPGVLAYELLNEPWFGDWIKDPSIFFESGEAERKTVGPYMQRMHDVVRENDKDTPTLYAPAELNNRFMRHVGYQNGFLPGEPMAFHVYCVTGTDGDGPTSVLDIDICHFNDDFQLGHRQSDLRRLETAGFVTEFGAVSDKPTGIDEVRFVAEKMDDIYVSWAFWDHNLVFGDPIYEKELARAYPRAVAGEVSSFRFDATSATMELSFVSSPVDNSASGGIGDTGVGGLASSTTEIFVGAGFYPNGTNVTVTPPGCCTVSTRENGRWVDVASSEGSVQVHVTIAPAAV